MVSFFEFKKALGSIAKNLTDEQIDSARITLDHIADAVFDRWLKKRNTSILDSLDKQKGV